MTLSGNQSQSQCSKKILYIKGGNVVEEGCRLIGKRGEILKGGPDQFLLAALTIINRDNFLRVCSFGKDTKSKKIDNVEFLEYQLRAIQSSTLGKVYNFLTELLRFAVSSSIYSPKIIICGVEGPIGFTALVCAKACRARFIFSVHNALYGLGTSNLDRIFNKFLIHFSNRVIVHGKFLADQASYLGADKFKLLEYASTIDSKELNQIKNIKNVKSHKQEKIKRIIFIGRMEANKGIYDLLKAFCMAKIENTELLYVGAGSSLDKIRNLACRDNVQNVQFLGQIPFNEIFHYLSAAFILVAPTRPDFPEGRCKSIVEAFLAGVPVIAPNYGPFPYLVEDNKNGLLYKPGSVEELSEAIKKAINTPNLIMYLREGAIKSGNSLLNAHSFFDALTAALATDAE